MLERPETESAQGSLEGQEAFPSFSDVVPLKKTTFMLERPETESAQGSLEGQEAFPSFSDVVLVAQGLSKDSPE
ncbi:hypothetical protein IscW_ISCW005752 [Ixodes scapularis]|uniref:Uncharacterized protein n=1 Tax=Ixodes scapularis TaxID=6945 RepID=B7PP41_IXOSC|nr:hypothetical protein IscW_ISCW005752 [Ixodes scapularis]|eukprot:XP_002435533.1 hypothetical protein IscW_ISCW005752 [Ixodes scapularis]